MVLFFVRPSWRGTVRVAVVEVCRRDLSLALTLHLMDLRIPSCNHHAASSAAHIQKSRSTMLEESEERNLTSTRPFQMRGCWLSLATTMWFCWLPFASAMSSDAAVRVQVQQSLALTGVTPSQAKEAWLSYQWKKGGGLPVFVTHSDETTRRLLPINMQEQLLQNRKDKNEIRYRVTDMGLLASDLVQDSHLATIQFQTDEDDTVNMIWNVQFEAKRRADFWKTVTEMNVGTAAANLASYLSVPLLYRRTTKFRPTDNGMNLSEEWVNFVWRQGGGLPVFPPIQLDEMKRIYVPPFLLERIESVKDDEIEYAVDNPGLFTYQVHTHKGRVRFQTSIPASNEMEMVWEVEVRPLKGFSWLVQLFTSAVISTLARNFKVHVTDPGAMVKVAPPRGKGDAFGEVPKDTWLGGVLASHLSDKRSTVEQTLAIFQPWTWGRSTDDEGEGDEWTTGCMSD